MLALDKRREEEWEGRFIEKRRIQLGCKGCEIEKRRNWEERLGAGWAPYL
jgi:hypothetical protein